MLHRIHIVRPFLEPNFLILTEKQELANTLQLEYGSFISPEPPSDTTFQMDLTQYPEIQEELLLIEDTMYDRTRVQTGYLALHAATVEFNGKVYLLAGKTESGKSTLTAFLCSNGCGYYSDDLAIINQKTLQVSPYPRPIHLRQGGLSVLQKNGVSTESSITFSYGAFCRTTMPLEPALTPQAEIGAILFLERNTEINQAECMTKDEGFVQLVKNQFVYSALEPSQIALFQRIGTKPLIKMKYKDMEYVKQWISQM